MIKTLTLTSGETLTLKNSLGYKVRFQNNFGKSCDAAMMEMTKTQDTLVMIQIAYCMALPTPTVDFESFCDGLEAADILPLTHTVAELVSGGMPSEKQVKKAKN